MRNAHFDLDCYRKTPRSHPRDGIPAVPRPTGCRRFRRQPYFQIKVSPVHYNGGLEVKLQMDLTSFACSPEKW